jgi:hypothetical protein
MIANRQFGMFASTAIDGEVFTCSQPKHQHKNEMVPARRPDLLRGKVHKKYVQQIIG